MQQQLLAMISLLLVSIQLEYVLRKVIFIHQSSTSLLSVFISIFSGSIFVYILISCSISSLFISKYLFRSWSCTSIKWWCVQCSIELYVKIYRVYCCLSNISLIHCNSSCFSEFSYCLRTESLVRIRSFLGSHGIIRILLFDNFIWFERISKCCSRDIHNSCRYYDNLIVNVFV